MIITITAATTRITCGAIYRRLIRLVGPSRALELLAGNVALDADAALRLGLVNRVVADDEFSAAWTTWAREFAAGPTAAVAGMKANVRDASRLWRASSRRKKLADPVPEV